MKRLLILLVVLAQLAVLFGMAGQREWISRHGQHILLRTAPYDPLDYMRGRYARLNYEISNVPASLCRDAVKTWFAPSQSFYRAHRDERVYALLAVDENGDARLTALTDREPASGLYLRGRVDSVSTKWIRVRYGIEALFLQENEAAKMDPTGADRANNIMLDAVVAVSKNGTAVLQKTQREPLALTLKLQRVEDKNSSTKTGIKPHRLIGVTAILTNHGKNPIAVILRPEGKSFRLVPAPLDYETPYPWVNENTALPPPTQQDVKTLAPGESTSQYIDLNDPYWALLRPEDPASKSAAERVPSSSLETQWGFSYRLEYTPHIQASDPLHGTRDLSSRVVPSPSFKPVGSS